MKRYRMERVYLSDRTLSTLTDPSQPPEHREVAKILELPWKDNDHNVSCIPEGVYQVIQQPPKESRPYPYFRFVEGQVPNRKGILIHRGTKPQDSRGCLLAGSRFADVTTDAPILESSTVKLQWMIEHMPKVFEIEIVKKAI